MPGGKGVMTPRRNIKPDWRPPGNRQRPAGRRSQRKEGDAVVLRVAELRSIIAVIIASLVRHIVRSMSLRMRLAPMRDRQVMLCMR